jgi:hypothetical protein
MSNVPVFYCVVLYSFLYKRIRSIILFPRQTTIPIHLSLNVYAVNDVVEDNEGDAVFKSDFVPAF